MTIPPAEPPSWLRVTRAGLACEPGGFHIDPGRAVERAVITHGHADHARPGHGAVLATPETIAIMRSRFGDDAAGSFQPLRYGETLRLGGVAVRLVPAGHVLGSAQVVLTRGATRIVVSGDYKRRRDPTCVPFEPVVCDLFVTEATFALPVFRHPPAHDEIAKLLASRTLFPERCQLVGAYALGKCQRVIKLLREAGYDRPLYLHGALTQLCALYEAWGIGLGDLRLVADTEKEALKGEIVLAPPGAINDRWSRRLPDPLPAMASGWMRVRARARQRGAELPLIISDHADWDELTETLADVAPRELWITHGREDALAHYAASVGIAPKVLALTGREEEGGEA
jgi:putative mRNA 3-end processing factor